MANLLRFSLLSIYVAFACSDETDTLNHRILGGTITERNKWPFIAALFRGHEPNFFCGGTIISQRHILTAAHCLEAKTGGKLTYNEIVVRLGAYNITDNNEEGSVESKVAQIRVHDDWDNTHDDYDADIAILVLKEKIAYTKYIDRIDLPADNIRVDGATINVEGTVVGWGRADKSIHEPILKEATIHSINDSYCYRANFNIVPLSSHRTFCAGFGSGVPNRGDSGGGYFVDNGYEWVQYGVVSAINLNDQGHLNRNAIAVYANVKSFKGWILATVNETMDIESAEMGIDLNCNFGDFYKIYTCRLRDLDILSDNIEIANVIGLHDAGKTNTDVEEIKFERSTMLFLPNGIGTFFTNLTSVKVGQSLGMDVIKRSNLRNLNNLQELSIYKNEVKILDEDTLWDLSSLEIFQLIKNKLKVLHVKTFDENKKLREVNLRSNQLELLPRDLFLNNNVLERIDFSENSLKIIEIDFTAMLFAKAFLFRKNICIDFQSLNGVTVELQRLITSNC